MPKTVKEIRDYAFDGCTSLKNVWYGGTATDKSKITIAENNTPIKNATWHYSETEQ